MTIEEVISDAVERYAILSKMFEDFVIHFDNGWVKVRVPQLWALTPLTRWTLFQFFMYELTCVRHTLIGPVIGGANSLKF